MNELPFVGQVATQGVLGILLALSIFLNWYFIKKIQDVNEKRVSDAQEITGKLLEPISAIKMNSDLLISLFNRFLNTPQGGNGR